MKLKYSNSAQQGMTLIEIMVALVLGLFLVSGVMQVFVSSNQTYRMQENLSRMQENGRFAMRFLTEDIRMADYMGCLKDGIGNLNSKLDSTDVEYDAVLHAFDGSNGIEGTEGIVNANRALDLPDEIIIRGVFDAGISVVAPYMANTSANIKLSNSNGLAQYDIVLLSDCKKADILEITTNPTTGVGTTVLVHNSGAVAKGPGNKNQPLSKIYKGDASVYKINTYVYSLSAEGLFKKSISSPGTISNNELVEGIENMQILYGADTNGDKSPDYYVPYGTVGLAKEQIVSVRISLLIVSRDDNLTSIPRAYTFNGGTATPADRRLRRVFTSTIAIRNRLQ